MKYLAITTATLALLLPAAAQANTAEENRDLAVASAYWGTETSCPAASVTVQHDLVPTDARAAQAPIGGCAKPEWRTISIRAGYVSGGSTYCQLLVHEYGHLTGQQHAPGGVMAADVSMYSFLVPGCAALDRIPVAKKCKSKRYKRSHPKRCRHTESEGV